MTDRTERVAERSLERAGREVTIENRTATETDEEGDPIWETPDQTTATVLIIHPGSRSYARRIEGVDAAIDAIAIAPPDAPLTTGGDDDLTAASRIIDGSDTFVVSELVTERSQLYRALLIRES